MRILISTFFLLFLIQPQFGYSQKILIKYGIDDCINCSALLYQMRKIVGEERIHFILPQGYQSDSTLIVKQRGFDLFNFEVHFSDSLYNVYKKGIESLLILDWTDSVTIRKLKSLDLDEFRKLTEKEPSHSQSKRESGNSEICLPANNSDNGFSFINEKEIVSFNSQLARNTYQDLSSGSFIEIFADSSWLKSAYKSYFDSDRFELEYNFYKVLAQANPSLSIGASFISSDDSLLFFLTSVPFFDTFSTSEVTNVTVSTKSFVTAFHRGLNTAIYSMHVSSIDLGDYWVSGTAAIKINTDYYFTVSSSIYTTGSRIAAHYKCEDQKLNFVGFLPFELPSNYLKFGLENHFRNILVDQDIFCLSLGNVVYDLSTQTTIEIPIAPEVYESLSDLLVYAFQYVNGEIDTVPPYYTIISVAKKNDNIGVLYRDHLRHTNEIVFDRNSKIISHTKIEAIDGLGKQAIYYHPVDKNQIIYLKKEDEKKCFRSMSIY